MSADVPDVPERFGRYLVMRPLRQVSGMGALAIAYDTVAAELVVLKRLRGDTGPGRGATRFREEAALSRQLDHAHLVRCRDAGEHAGVQFIAFDWVPGRNLDDVAERARRLDVLVPGRLAAVVARQVCHALAYVHARADASGAPLGLVHRDVSPANIMLDWSGVARLLDFGIAVSARKRSRTMPGMVPGTPGFLSPEQRSGVPLDARTDVYSLGAVCYYLLSGRMPYHPHGGDIAPAPPRLGSIAGLEVEAALDDIVARALAPLAARFASAAELGAALDGYLAAHPADSHDVARFLSRIFPSEERDSHDAMARLAAEAACWKPPLRTATPTEVVVVRPRRSRERRTTWRVPVQPARRRRGLLALALLLGLAGIGVGVRAASRAPRWPSASPTTTRVVATTIATVQPSAATAPPPTAAAQPPAPPPIALPPPPAVPTPLPIAAAPARPPAAAVATPLTTTRVVVESTPAIAPAPRRSAAPHATHPRVDVTPLLARARDEFRRADYGRAVATATQAIKLGGGVDAWLTRADVEVRLGRRAEAARDFKAALRLAPGNEAARAGLTFLHEEAE